MITAATCRPLDCSQSPAHLGPRQPLGATIFALAALLAIAANGNRPVEDSGIPYTGMDDRELAGLKGKPLVIYLRTGKMLDDMEVIQLRAGKKPGTLHELVFKPAVIKANRRVLSPGAVERITVDGKPYLVVGDGKKDPWRLVDVERREKVVAERLTGAGEHLWIKPTAEEQKAHLKEQKAFFDEVKAQFPRQAFSLHETDYFLFLTNMPAGEVHPFIADLDKMYLILGQAFGVPKGENIWLGKAAVIAFVDPADFKQFELTMMAQDAADSRGMCHSRSDGDVLIACYRGDSAKRLAGVLVHETTHGYLHRYRSTVTIPLWINEGVADWVAGQVVSSDLTVVERQLEAAQIIKGRGSLGTFFEADSLEAWQYGLASSLVEMLVKIDPRSYRRLIDGIKEGQSWQDSLQSAYGLSPDDLAQLYGERIGVATLTQ